MQPTVDSTLVQALERALKDRNGIKLALLFGSYAKGTARGDSDIDIAVLAPRGELLELGAELSIATGRDVDIVHLDDATIPMLEQLIEHSVVIHQSPGAAANWRSKVLAELETDRPWYRRMRDAWLAHVAKHGV